MTFLRNRWYVAALSTELGLKPLARKILGEEITLYRTASGGVAALASRCPHRFAPLSFGDIKGENLKCRYHGLEFGPNGNCMVNPDGSAPPPIKAKSYKVAEKNAMVWIWMGEAEPTIEIPKSLDFKPGMGGVIQGYLHLGGNALLASDNLMDAVHATHLHTAFRTEGHIKNPKQDVRQEGDVVQATTLISDTPLVPSFRPLYPKEGNVDQWIILTWETPIISTVNVGVSPVGKPKEDGVSVITVHLITPETEKSCHYFWVNTRDCQLQNHQLSETIRSNFQRIFTEEDKWMIEGQERMMEGQEFWSLRPALMAQDKAAVLARRRYEALVAEQAATASQG